MTRRRNARATLRPFMAQPRRTRIVVWAATMLALSVALSLVWTVLLARRSGRVVTERCGPEFCLRVAEGVRDHGLFSSEQRYEIWITRRGSPDYGYVLHHSFAWTDFDTDKTIRACRVEWTADGVTLLEPSGQRVFVPARLYERGR